MTETELLHILACGEDSRHQFKRDVTNADSLAAELAALANSGGGCLLLGVADDGTVAGLDASAVQRPTNYSATPPASTCARRSAPPATTCRRRKAW